MTRTVIRFSSLIRNVATIRIAGTGSTISSQAPAGYNKSFIRNIDRKQQRLTYMIRFSSTVSPTSTEATDNAEINETNITSNVKSISSKKKAGEELYQKYVNTLQELEQLKLEQERMKSEKLFEAWKSTQPETSNNDSNNETTTNQITLSNKNKNAGGVAVVRTLARETHKNNENDPSQILEARAMNQLQIAAIKYKHPTALVELANSELKSISERTQHGKEVPMLWVKEKIDSCMQYYHIAGEAGEATAYYNLGHLYWDGVGEIIKADQDEALQYFHQAIHLGDTDAMFFVGAYRLTHRHKYRIDQIKKALQWIEEAANHGHGGALHYLVVIYMNGYKTLNIQPCTDDEFQRRMALAIAHDDDGEAYFLRGACHYAGRYGYPKDIVLCFNDYVSAAELDHPDACINAGVMLHKGVPGKIDQDQSRAFQYYQRAGELGNIEGWRNVVSCYLTGQGVKQSEEMAKYIGETMLRPHDEKNDKHNKDIKLGEEKQQQVEDESK
jgi:TPR repeat protein